MSEAQSYQAGNIDKDRVVYLASDFDNVTRLFLDAAERCIASERREKELQQRLTAADEQIDLLTRRQAEPVEWGAPKTVRQLIRQLETTDQDLRPLSMLRVPGGVFKDGKERTRAVHLSFSNERVDGQWLVPFKSEGEKVLAFWCRMEQPAPATAPLDYGSLDAVQRLAVCRGDVVSESGSTCNEIREEAGQPINRPCKACGGGACIDR